MSSIPNAAIPHAKPHEDQPAMKPRSVKQAAKDVVAKVKADPRTKSVTKAVKDNPKTVAAIGATVIAGAAAAIAAPFVIDKDKPAKKAAPKKAPAKKPAAKKPAAKKSPARKPAAH